MPFTPNEEGWDELVKQIVRTEVTLRMKQVADACNEQADLAFGYMVGIEGDDILQKHDYRMTVITATGAAMDDNARNNTLLKNFHLAWGD